MADKEDKSSMAENADRKGGAGLQIQARVGAAA
jgi:hypothetical protein